MKPTHSYIIWFSQRTGSTLLCKMLESICIAGVPNEWLHHSEDLLTHYGVDSADSLQRKLWEIGSSQNGVFGLKLGMSEPHNSHVLDVFRQLSNAPDSPCPRSHVWEAAFPNCRHIFMTRRNKVRLAVSWWKAIKTDEWHRSSGKMSATTGIQDQYHFDAIRHLVLEATMREAAIQEFFTESGISPLNIVYEDFVMDHEGTIKSVLNYLGLPQAQIKTAAPFYEKLADEVSEDWVQRFRKESQVGWKNIGW